MTISTKVSIIFYIAIAATIVSLSGLLITHDIYFSIPFLVFGCFASFIAFFYNKFYNFIVKLNRN